MAWRRLPGNARSRHDHSAPEFGCFTRYRHCRLQQRQRRRFEASIAEHHRGPTWLDGYLQRRDGATLPVTISSPMPPSLIDKPPNVLHAS